jgi:superfamily II DNA/RNA helicase
MRQTLFFSATLSDDIQKLGNKFVMNPKVIEVAPPASTADTVAQHLIWTDVKSKRQVLRDILRQEAVNNAVIFCNRKRDIAVLVKSLTRHGFSAVALHGDMTQSARLEALQRFKDGEVPLMIASDVAARGLDIAGLSHVFNFDIPGHAEDYVHRIGRTGRAGRSGRAFSIAAGKDDQRYVEAIESLTGKVIPKIALKDGTIIDASETGASVENRSQAGADEAGEPVRKRRGKSSGSKSKPGQTDDGQQMKADKPGKKHNKPAAKNRNRDDELPSPPDCTGNSFKDSGHIPAFLWR